jgi:ParB-like chromosome segregation protein Spo0J
MHNIADLTPDKRNARKRTERSSSLLEKSLSEVGAARSIVIDEDNVILAGNGTVEAAASVGITNVQIVEADGNTIIAVRRRGLTKKQKERLALYDNKTSDESEWDMEMLNSMDLDSLNGIFDPDELTDIFAPENEDETKCECPNCGNNHKA